jgi:hypothetical protein
MNVPRAQGALLNVSEAAARFGVSQRQIRNFVARAGWFLAYRSRIRRWKYSGQSWGAMRISSSPIASGTIEVASEARVPVAPDTLGTAFWRARKAAGIPDIRIHNLRHTAATRTMRKTRNLAVVQRQLGHKRVTTTMRYAHVAEADLRAAINATNPVESPAATSADVANRPEKLDKIA